MDLGQTVHRFFIHGTFSWNRDKYKIQEKQNSAETSDALGLGQPLQRNEDVKSESGGRQLEEPELSAL